MHRELALNSSSSSIKGKCVNLQVHLCALRVTEQKEECKNTTENYNEMECVSVCMSKQK